MLQALNDCQSYPCTTVIFACQGGGKKFSKNYITYKNVVFEDDGLNSEKYFKEIDRNQWKMLYEKKSYLIFHGIVE